MNVFRRLADPILYRLGYTHYSTQISGVTSFEGGEVVGETVMGLLEFPGFDQDVVYVDFTGVIVDPESL